jgi:hypothetical protein
MLTYCILSVLLQPTPSPVTKQPSPKPVTTSPTKQPTFKHVTDSPSKQPTLKPVTNSPIKQPTVKPVTNSPSKQPTPKPTTKSPVTPPPTMPVCQDKTICDSMRQKLGYDNYYVGQFVTKGCFSEGDTAYFGIGGDLEDMFIDPLPGNKERLWCDFDAVPETKDGLNPTVSSTLFFRLSTSCNPNILIFSSLLISQILRESQLINQQKARIVLI